MTKYVVYFILLGSIWHAPVAQVEAPEQPVTAQGSTQPREPQGEQTKPEPEARSVSEPDTIEPETAVPDTTVPETTVFNPSEEISEDLPVPFPVDI